MKERAGYYSARLLLIVTKKRRAESEAALNDVSDSAQFYFILFMLLVAVRVGIALHSLRIRRSL